MRFRIPYFPRKVRRKIAATVGALVIGGAGTGAFIAHFTVHPGPYCGNGGTCTSTTTSTTTTTTTTTTSSSHVGIVGTGPSLASCTGGACTQATCCLNGTNISVSLSVDLGNGVITQHVYPMKTPNLVCTSGVPCPVVFVFPDDCTVDSGSGKGPCFNETAPDNGLTDWAKEAPIGKFLVVAIFADSSGNYYTHQLYGTPSTGESQALEVVATLNYLESSGHACTTGTGDCVDHARIFGTGGSKGGFMTNEILCNASTESIFAGTASGSAIISSSGTVRTKPPAARGTCPTLVAAGTTLPNPAASVRPLMAEWWFSAGDGSYKCSNVPGVDGVSAGNLDCLNGGGNCTSGACGSPGSYAFSQDEQATLISDPAFACSNTPSNASIGTGGAVKVRTYGSCGSNAFNQAEVQVMDYSSGGCHAFGCDGVSSVDPAQQVWKFWTTG